MAALCREVLEETCLEIKEIKKYLGYFDYSSKYREKTRQFNFFVDCEDRQDVHISQVEHSMYYWASLHDTHQLLNLNISTEVRKVIETLMVGLF